MTEGIEISILNDEKLIKKLTLFENLAIKDDSIFENIVIFLKNNILLRTAAGKSYTGRSFKKYNPQYAKKNQKTTVNMQLTGEMMNSVTHNILSGFFSGKVGRIFFMDDDSRKKAIWHNIQGAGRGKVIRKFFGVSITDEKQALRSFDNEVKRVKKDIGL